MFINANHAKIQKYQPFHHLRKCAANVPASRFRTTQALEEKAALEPRPGHKQAFPSPSTVFIHATAVEVTKTNEKYNALNYYGRIGVPKAATIRLQRVKCGSFVQPEREVEGFVVILRAEETLPASSTTSHQATATTYPFWLFLQALSNVLKAKPHLSSVKLRPARISTVNFRKMGAVGVTHVLSAYSNDPSTQDVEKWNSCQMMTADTSSELLH